MTVSTVTNTAATTTTAASSSSSSSSTQSTFNLDFASYLKILTAQLKNQDPTNATDPNQFTQQLVQLGNLQAASQTNTDLSKLISLQTSSSLATGVGYIGNYVESSTTSQDLALQGGKSEIGFTLANTASSVKVDIVDSSGNTVTELTGAGVKGTNYVSWNGTDSSGNQVADGSYNFQVSALDANGNNVAVSNYKVLAKVTGVQTASDGSLSLQANGLTVSAANVDAVYTPSSLPSTSG